MNENNVTLDNDYPEFISNPHSVKIYLRIILGLVIIAGLYTISRYNFLLFHSLAESFSIVIAFGIFMFVWNLRRFIDNNYFIVIGISYLFISGIELIHTLAYKGMNVFEGHTTNLPTQLWISARYLQSITLFAAPFLIGKKIKTRYLFLIYSIITLAIFVSIFYWRNFPLCFKEGFGLTEFKKVSEYIISGLMAGAIALLYKKKNWFEKNILKLVVLSIFLTIISELIFTLYSTAYGFFNASGHIFAIFSYYFIYEAIIVTGLKNPFNLLYGKLKHKEKTLLLTKFSIDHAEDLMFWINPEGIITDVNISACQKLSYTKDELINSKISLIDNDILPGEFDNIIASLNREDTLILEHRFITKAGNEIPTEVEFKSIEFENKKYYFAFARDITERKRAREIIESSLNEKVMMLKEIHHRVKNNLQVITSLFRLQSAYIKDEASREIFKESQNRVKSMALIHEKLYSSKDLNTVSFKDYLNELVSSLLNSYKYGVGKINLSMNIDNIEVGVDLAINLGLIANELVTNSLKYAFPEGKNKEGKECKLSIKLAIISEGRFLLSIKDNGIGFPKDLDFRKTESLGLQLVNSLVEQHNGEIKLLKNNGTEFVMIFSY